MTPATDSSTRGRSFVDAYASMIECDKLSMVLD
jgi:hypothetical protein